MKLIDINMCTQSSFACLKHLSESGYKYIARSADGHLNAFVCKPTKEINFWYAKGEVMPIVQTCYFDYVEWCDLEPLNIMAELKKIRREHQKNA